MSRKRQANSSLSSKRLKRNRSTNLAHNDNSKLTNETKASVRINECLMSDNNNDLSIRSNTESSQESVGGNNNNNNIQWNKGEKVAPRSNKMNSNLRSISILQDQHQQISSSTSSASSLVNPDFDSHHKLKSNNLLPTNEIDSKNQSDISSENKIPPTFYGFQNVRSFCPSILGVDIAATFLFGLYDENYINQNSTKTKNSFSSNSSLKKSNSDLENISSSTNNFSQDLEIKTNVSNHSKKVNSNATQYNPLINFRRNPLFVRLLVSMIFDYLDPGDIYLNHAFQEVGHSRNTLAFETLLSRNINDSTLCLNWARPISTIIMKDNHILQAIERTPKLRFFSIDGQGFHVAVAPSSIMKLAHCCPLLEVVNLSKCVNLNNKSIITLVQKCNFLRSLNLADCYELTDEAIKIVAENCPNLVDLNLQWCANVTFKSIKIIAQSCPHLRSLNLCNCVELNDETVVALAKGCQNLRALHLGGCEFLTDISVSAIARNCTSMCSLSLGRCSLITDLSLIALAQHCPNLMHIDLQACSKIRSAGIEQLAVSCPYLIHLDLEGCINVNDRTLNVISEANMLYLTSLELVQCNQITDKGITKLVSSCQQLRSLNVIGCSQLTPHCKENIKITCRRLKLWG